MMNVLLVDDSRTARSLLKRIFVELGNWDILEAENGQDALERLNGISSMDLICIDWNMPIMNGLEFLKQAKKNPDFSDTWMMMVTTETELANMNKAMVSGANEYVMKPFTKDIILAKLEMMGLVSSIN